MGMACVVDIAARSRRTLIQWLATAFLGLGVVLVLTADTLRCVPRLDFKILWPRRIGVSLLIGLLNRCGIFCFRH